MNRELAEQVDSPGEERVNAMEIQGRYLKESVFILLLFVFLFVFLSLAIFILLQCH